MKKTIKILFSVFCASAVLAACAKEAVQEKEGTEDQQIITAYVNANPTKLTYEEVVEGGGAGMTSTWQNGDHFLAIQDGEKVVDFKLISGAGTTQGVFQTLTSGVTSSTEWVGVVGNGAQAVGSEIHCSYMGQNGTIKSLGGFNYVKVTATGEEPYFNFAEGEGLSYVMRIKLPAGIKCIEYTPCSWTKITTDATEVIYYNSGSSESSWNNAAYTNVTTITLSTTSVEGGFIYLSLPLANYANDNGARWGKNSRQAGNLKAGVIITIMNDVSDNATLSTGTVFNENLSAKGGKITTLDLSGETLIARAKPSDAIYVEKTGDIQCNVSSFTYKAKEVKTYWSPFNIGATKPSEIGNYYAWSEYKTKSTYTFDSFTNKHNGYNDCMAPKFYINGTQFKFSMANTRFDTARILWGSAWRMPHMIEAYAASNGCTSYSTLDGQAGITFNGIFIPNSRYMDGDKLNDSTTPHAKDYSNDNYDCARFWSADQINRSESEAGWNEVYTFGTAKGEAEFDWWRRQQHLGFPIRPVLNSSILK